MKTSIKVVAALLLSGILIATTLPRKAGAQGHTVQSHQVVIIEAQEYYNVTDQGTAAAKYTFSGFYVYNIDASPGAPRLATIIPQINPYNVTTNQLSAVIAGYMNLGFRIDHSDGGFWVLTN